MESKPIQGKTNHNTVAGIMPGYRSTKVNDRVVILGTKLGGLREIYSHSSEVQYQGVSAGLSPSKDSEGESVHAFLPASGGLLATLGVLWPVETSPHSSSHAVPPLCLYSNFPF